MTRVAFQLNFRDRSWMGGVNYFRNLFEALRLSDSQCIEPVIMAGYSADKGILKSLGDSEIYLSPWGDTMGWRWKVRRALALGIGCDFIYERKLKAERIELVSHMGYLGERAGIPSLVWIPDFQERYFPEFFSGVELNARSRENRNVIQHASAILLSSEHAREGLAQISLEAAERAYVLPFVASVPDVSDIPSYESLVAKYDLPENFFFLPNQFWKHKNHEVVIRALGVLKRSGKPLTVVATGNLHDHRQPEHAQYLLRMIEAEKVASEFRILGMVPYLDLMGLMANAVAVLNPSLFEGWSTTVEESKSLGKVVIISDIPVHREQAPERGVFFDPADPDELASVLVNVSQAYSQESEISAMSAAQLKFPARRLNFAHKYQKIVYAVIEGEN